MTSKYLTIPVVAGALGLGGAAVARAAEPTTAELQAQIQALQTKVQTMEAQQVQQAQKLDAKDVDATVDSVLKDAEKRSKMMQMEGFTAGWSDGNFMLRSADGSFLMIPELQLQFRYILNYRTDDDTFLSDSDTELGFEVARAKLGFRGNAFTKDLTYNIRFVTGSAYSGNSAYSANSLSLENAYLQYQFADNMAVKLGQWKDNVYHEGNVEDVNQLAVDRSLVNQLIGNGITDYVQGVALVYNDKSSPLRAELGFHDGIDTANTAFTNVGGGATDPDFTNGKTNFGVSGRVEYALMGSYADYGTMTRAATWGGTTMQHESKDMLVLGAGFDVTQDGDTNAFFHTIDAEWKPTNLDKFALYGAYLGLFTADANTSPGTTQDFYDWGFLVQAGWMLNDKWEVFGRFDYTKADSDRGLPQDDISELTVGVNYYWYGQGAKFTIDGSWLPNGSPANIPALGYLPSADDSFVLRAQVQLAI
jgi:hypothetical protein